MNNLVERAKALAYSAHAGQVDKAGRPYIEHVARVADAVSDDPEAEAIAWLHDVLEDCPGYEGALLSFPVEVRRPVIRLTRYKFHAPSEYYDGIKRHPRALRVKLADIADNADESRLALLDDKTADRLRRKYAKALQALEQTSSGTGG